MIISNRVYGKNILVSFFSFISSKVLITLISLVVTFIILDDLLVTLRTNLYVAGLYLGTPLVLGKKSDAMKNKFIMDR